MSSYFDAWDREVSAIADEPDDDTFLARLAVIETPHIKRISLICGDREFPHDLREKAMRILTQYAVGTVSAHIPPTDHAAQWARTMRSSEVCTRLHSLFHEIGQRRHVTRYGVLDDNPHSILARRDEHDGTDVASMVPLSEAR